MKVDESGAPWPYEEVEPGEDDEGVPTWECPEGICECHPPEGEIQRNDHKIHFFDHDVKRMPGARCRVFENGQLVNKESPWADESGAVSVKVHPGTRSLRVEWAPAELPLGPRYPYRRIYHVTLEPTGNRGVQQRLENIGFFAFNALRDNVRDFQHEYILASHQTTEHSGEPAHITKTLRAFHDFATLPPLGTKVPPAPAEDIDREKAKTGGEDKEGDAHPAQAPQGCVANPLRPALSVTLVNAFSIQKGTLHAPAQTTPEALSDPDKILEELYGSKITYRFPPTNEHKVRKANLTYYFDGAKKGTIQTDNNGLATIDLKGAPPGGKLRVVVLPPDENDLSQTRTTKKRLQINKTNAPAGPKMTDKDTALERMYRPFIIEMTLDANGLVPLDASCAVPDKSKILVSPAKAPPPDDTTGDVSPDAVQGPDLPAQPAYVKLIDVTLAKVSAGRGNPPALAPGLVVDWRFDWAKAPRPLRDPAWNAFTKSKSGTAQQQATLPVNAPLPCLVQHQTHSPYPWSGVIQGFLLGRDTSAHYVVDLDGHVVKLVDEYYVAWHAGDSQWNNKNAVNYFSVGIENIHSDTTPPGADDPVKYTPRDFPKEQCDAIVRLSREIVDFYQIAPRRVVGHRDVNVIGPRLLAYPNTKYRSRKTGGKPDCPGICFPWSLLEKEKIALAHATSPQPLSFPDEDDSEQVPKEKVEEQTRIMKLFSGAPAALNDPEKPHLPLKSSARTKAQTAEDLKLLRQLLFDIGYSVSKQEPAPPRKDLPGKLDEDLIGAVGAFQTHHFSHERRAYRHEERRVDSGKRKTSLDARPRIGHIDSDTIREIIRVWWALA